LDSLHTRRPPGIFHLHHARLMLVPGIGQWHQARILNGQTSSGRVYGQTEGRFSEASLLRFVWAKQGIPVPDLGSLASFKTLPVRLGRYAKHLPEPAGEVARALKAALLGNRINWQGGVDDQLARLAQSCLQDVLAWRFSGAGGILKAGAFADVPNPGAARVLSLMGIGCCGYTLAAGTELG